MKRYGTLLTDEGMFSHEYLYEDPEGDWVRYEDAVAAVHDERSFALSEAQRAATAQGELELLHQRVYNLEGDWATAQAAAKAYHAELEALKLRVAKAIVTLSSAGYWSEFARLALKELRG